MVGHSRSGRPAKPGDRYPGGKLKPESNSGVAPAKWARVRELAEAGAGDVRLATQIGRLSIHKLLTDTQTATAFRVGEIYSRFERYKGKRRTPKAQNFEFGFGGSGIAEELMTPEALFALEDRIRDAEHEFMVLQEELSNYPTVARSVLEQLCVENCAINSAILPDLRVLLNRLAEFFSKEFSKKRRRQPGEAKPRAKPLAQEPKRRADERECWKTVARAMRPDLSEEKLDEAYELYLAVKDREFFRVEKPPTST